MVQIVRVEDQLPDNFESLRGEAAAGGWAHLDRLANAWFESRAGLEAVMAAYAGGTLAGIGALTLEPADAGALRLRRFYVGEGFRRQGVGRTLASALMQEGLARSASLTVNAPRPEARAFWEAMGFRPDQGNGWSHRYGD